MKKLILTAFCLSIAFVLKAEAGVTFLAEAPESVGVKPNTSNKSCIQAGYTYTTCAGALVNPCPDDGNYYKVCCPAGYKYTLTECGARPHSTDNCYGYYYCGEQTTDEHCKAEGFTSKLPIATCVPNGPCTSYTMPGCSGGTTLKFCNDDTGQYWKCE
ncbi:MAG: hypothetical protein IJ870_04870 [Alphaproteobacteria bacterium]|nr:hypothetical protein [Alphaproteobacteria bacterium]